MKTTGREIRSRWLLYLLCLGHLVMAGAAAGEEPYQKASVVEPFLEIHTGPGAGYPIFYIAEHGEEILLLKRRTDWYRIRLSNGKEGWVHRSEIEKTLLAQGRKKRLMDRIYDDYLAGRMEMGWGAGEFGGDPSLYVRMTYFLTDVLSLEGNASFVSSNLGTTRLYQGGIVVTPWKWRGLSLSGTLGGGVVYSAPSSLIVGVTQKTFQVAHAGVGISIPLVRDLSLQGDFRNHTVFMGTGEIKEFQEYSVGLSFRF
ncbi:MAG TPA: SH3 domain-containing protein [Nitrospiria bacterium]|nr:SH3 domain-containing protein [Nitrospiria bacterium]